MVFVNSDKPLPAEPRIMNGYGLTELAPLGIASAGAVRGRLAMKFLGIAFFESDFRTDMVRLTPNGFAMFGLPIPDNGEMPRGLFWSCYHPDDRLPAIERFMTDLRRDLERDDYCECVRIIHQETGETRWIEFTGQMFGPRAHRTHIIGLMRDVTDTAPMPAGRPCQGMAAALQARPEPDPNP